MYNFIDITGKKFNRWKVLERMPNTDKGHAMWLCRCDCGTEKVVSSESLRNGASKSCGCLLKESAHKRLVDLSGMRFGYLTVIKRTNNDNWNGTQWLCRCVCGKITVVRGNSLKDKNKPILSCGCKNPTSKTHGMTGTRIYNIFSEMLARCFKLKASGYKYYGGRGITVCNRWLKFENFRDDMLESYNKHVEEFGEKQTTLDRIDSNGNYCKENCRWATWKEQGNNKRPRKLLKYNNKLYTVIECAKMAKICCRTFRDRLQRGWSVERAVTTPVATNGRRIKYENKDKRTS